MAFSRGQFDIDLYVLYVNHWNKNIYCRPPKCPKVVISSKNREPLEYNIPVEHQKCKRRIIASWQTIFKMTRYDILESKVGTEYLTTIDDSKHAVTINYSIWAARRNNFLGNTTSSSSFLCFNSLIIIKLCNYQGLDYLILNLGLILGVKILKKLLH